jgi:hypothetical protein
LGLKVWVAAIAAWLAWTACTGLGRSDRTKM